MAQTRVPSFYNIAFQRREEKISIVHSAMNVYETTPGETLNVVVRCVLWFNKPDFAAKTAIFIWFSELKCYGVYVLE